MNKYHAHPEDLIYKTKTFINELQVVQETYFNRLVAELKLNEEGEGFLFDYIYNSPDDVDEFDQYLQDFNKKYEVFVIKDGTSESPSNFLSLSETLPTMHMSSYEAEIETSFPSPYDDKEQVSCELLFSINSDKLEKDLE